MSAGGNVIHYYLLQPAHTYTIGRASVSPLPTPAGARLHSNIIPLSTYTKMAKRPLFCVMRRTARRNARRRLSAGSKSHAHRRPVTSSASDVRVSQEHSKLKYFSPLPVCPTFHRNHDHNDYNMTLTGRRCRN